MQSTLTSCTSSDLFSNYSFEKKLVCRRFPKRGIPFDVEESAIQIQCRPDYGIFEPVDAWSRFP